MTLVNEIAETFTNMSEQFIRSSNTEGTADGWRQVDTLRFMRQMKLQQEIRFCEYWLPRAEKRLDTQRGWVKHWLRARNCDEISENNYQASVAQSQAELFTVTTLKSLLSEAQAAYKADFGDGYSTAPTSNVLDDGSQPEVSAEERAKLAALGIEA